MRWLKVRKLIHESFADSVRNRVRIDVTNADPRGTSWSDTCKRGWITVDDHVVAHVEPHGMRILTLSLPSKGLRPKVVVFAHPWNEGQPIPRGSQLAEISEFPSSCWEYVNSSLAESLQSPDPFVSSLAVLNRKVGRQRLRRLSTQTLHPLTRWMVDFRLRAEDDVRKASQHGAAS